MGTTAEKLTYLNDTKQLLKENINNLGGNLTNEPFRQYASVLEGIYERLPKVSGIGASLSLSPSMVGKIKLNEIQGDTLQDGTPTPSSPVPIQSVTGLQNVVVCGKNLFDKSNVNFYANNNSAFSNTTDTNKTRVRTASFNTKYYGIKANTTYVVSGMPSGWSLLGVGTFTDPSSSNTGSATTSGATFTITDDSINYIYLLFGNNNSTEVASQSFRDGNIQIEKGSTATTYEPYKGNTYEVNLGKNLLDKSTLQEGYVTSTGTLTNTSPLGEMHSDFIKVQPNTTYTFKIFEISGTEYANWMGIGEYTANNISSFVRRDTMSTETQRYFTFTTSSTTQYVIVSARNLENATKVQLEKGNGTSYSPYFTPIELNKIGDYEDYIFKNEPNNPNYDSNLTLNSWYIEKNIGKVVLDGSESDSTYNTGTTGSFTRFGYLPFMSTDVCKIQSDYVSNYFKYLGTIGGDTTEAGISNTSVSGLNRLFIFLPTSTASTIAQFKTWLTTHNTEILYQLATPIYEVITNTELIEDLESLNNAKSEDGTTNINVTSEDLSMLLNVGVLKGE